MSADAAVVLLVGLLMAFFSGVFVGEGIERRRLARLTDLAAWLFHQLWLLPPNEWARVDIQRRGAHVKAIFHHTYDRGGKTVTYTNHFKGDLT